METYLFQIMEFLMFCWRTMASIVYEIVHSWFSTTSF